MWCKKIQVLYAMCGVLSCHGPGCSTAPPVIPLDHAALQRGEPLSGGPERAHWYAGVGVSPWVKGTLEINGERRGELLFREPVNLQGAQMLTAAWRKRVSGACEVGLDVGVGRQGGDLRCGVSSDGWGVNLATGAHLYPWQLVGWRGFVRGDVGYATKELVLLVSVGVKGGWSNMLVEVNGPRAESPSLVEDGREAPEVEVGYGDLSATGRITLGVGESRTGIPFISAGLSSPLALYGVEFGTCDTCRGEQRFGAFDPTLRLDLFAGMLLFY